MTRFVRNVLAVAYREATVLRHDRGFIAMLVVQPVTVMFLMGYVLSYTPAEVPWVVLDRSQTPPSRRLVGEIAASSWFGIPERVTSYDAGIGRLRAGAALGFLVVPEHFRRDVARGRRARVELLVDGSDPLSAARVAGGIGRIAAAFPVDGARPPAGPIDVRRRFWFNATLADREFFLAAIAGMLLTNLCLSATSLGIVGERESGTWEQLLALPTSPLEIVLGKLLPIVAICYLVLGATIAASGLLFGLWPQGSIAALVVVTLPFVLASMAIGVLVSTLARTSAQAVFLTVFFILPSFVLGGMLFPYALMPPEVRWVGALLPLRWYQIALRRVVARGGGLVDVLGPIGMLALIFAVLLWLIRRRMETRLG